ncbi:integral membrane protein MviN [Ketogulonicigenium robustum]|uniref:Probable lipid II flippase MurJ n=1 Tax=Ketogulonicigenium robustum TaxID=92947 RepID=A0A1W6NX82_9RHOB|nr:murein biosynthesis integral membrane protein MurJ [Ketogulonicigenium robustum]ARO13617.1 integral membrane protein MviN [Ketogulonicigenium robustum]
MTDTPQRTTSPIRLATNFVTVGLWTFLSRILGFARDILMAAYLGTGPVAEAFNIAFSLPNMFRRFFAEGAFGMAFIPMFSKKLESGDDPQGFARDAFSGMTFILTLFSVLCILIMPALVWAMASGFAGDARFGLATSYGRVAFPYILLISLTALLSGVLNASGRFRAAAAAPALLNLTFIPAILIGAHFDALPGGGDGTRIGLALAWAVPIAGVFQLATVWLASRRAGFNIGLQRPRLTPEMKRLAIIAFPAILAGGVVQINLLVGRQVASYFDGAINWLAYADRLYQLPLGVVGAAIGVVLLPELSRRLGAKDDAGGRQALNRSTEFALMLSIPAAVALVVIAVPLISVMYQRGAFTADDTAATALVLAVYGLGLPAFVLQKVLQPLYYAREDTRSPFRFALVALVVNAVAAVALAPFIGFVAAALGTTLAGWGMVAQLWSGSRNMGLAAQIDAQLRRRAWRICVAAGIMGVALGLGTWALQPLLGPGHMRYLALMILVFGGMGVYFVTGQALGAFDIREVKAMLRRRKA